jgi:hypothetical protein
MFNVSRTRPTFVFLLTSILLASPISGHAQTAIFTQSDSYASDLLYWNDPVYPSLASQNAALRSASTNDNDGSEINVDGDIVDASNHELLIGARIFCQNSESEVVASTESNVSGTYQFHLPKGKYTITASKLKYTATSKVITITNDTLMRLDFDMVPLVTSAGFKQVLTGALAEGNLKDITLENSKIAMSIADGSSDSQLGLATKGKPIDLSTTTGVDGFDWINLPLISTQKLSGIPGTIASMSRNVQFTSVKILCSTPTISKVLATGACTDLPLSVKNLYIVKPDKEWFDVTTTIQNVGDSAVSIWLGDAMDNDEYGQTSIYPSNRFNTSVIVAADMGLDEYVPAEPWIGCFGKSNQVFGIFYTGDFAKNFLISANTYRIASQKYITIQPGGIYTLNRKIAAVPVLASQTHSVALRSSFESSVDDNWGLESKIYLSKYKANPGDTIECTLTITNLSRYNAFEDVAATLSLPPFWKASADTMFFGTLNPKEAVEAIWHIIPTEGSGNTIIAGSALAWDEQFTFSETSVFVKGEGWYSGDNHMHSTFSDGSGSLPDLVGAAKAIGMSFITVTDHNTTKQDSAVKANSSLDFLAMTGCEVTPNYKAPNNWGHAVSLFSNVAPQFSNIPSQANAQAIVDNIVALNNGNGYAIMAHPFLKGCPWIYPNVTGFKGVEVWSCFTPVSGSYSKLAFNLWDKKNIAGLKQLGYAESDSHNLDMVGKPHIVAHLKNLSVDEIHNAMMKGQFYGSDGPAVRFTVDTVMMGGSLPVPSKRLVKISLKSYSPEGIDSMYLIKNGVVISGFSYANFTKNAQEIIYDEAIPGDFYRMECTDRWCRFAFSNPVFIVPAEQVTPQIVDTISTGMAAKKMVLNIGAYPNPGQDFVKLRTNLPTKADVTVYDTNSKVWLRESFNDETEKTLDVRSLPRGLYIVKVNENRFKLILH